MNRLSTSLAVAAFVLLARPCQAQNDSALVGHRVRVAVSDVRQTDFGPPFLELRGTLRDIRADTLYLAIPHSTTLVVISRRSVHDFAVSRGVPSRVESAFRRAFVLGALGAAAGFVYLHSSARDPGNTWEDAIGTGAVIGVGSGLVVGFAMPFERWRAVPR